MKTNIKFYHLFWIIPIIFMLGYLVAVCISTAQIITIVSALKIDNVEINFNQTQAIDYAVQKYQYSNTSIISERCYCDGINPSNIRKQCSWCF